MNYLNHNKRIVELCNGTFGESQAGKCFFPYEYIPEVIETTTSNVCFDISTGYDPANSTLTQVDIFFFMICHIEIAIMKDEPGLRYDLIAHEITKDFADSDFLGIGKAQLVYNKPYVAKQVMRGRVLDICIFDVSQELFNRRAGRFIQ